MMQRVEQVKPVTSTTTVACPPHGSVPTRKQRQRMKRAPYLDVSKVLNAPFGPPSGNANTSENDLHALRTRRPPRIFGLKEAPTFYPTAEEFASPLRYIESIRRIGEKAGVCKIVPPKGWKPDCALDTETFWFRTRIQKLNSMEGASRATLNCLDQLHKFHSQNNTVFNRVPTIDKKPVDLAKLRKEVSSRGGFQAVSDSKKWPEVARALGVSGKTFSNVAYTVKGLYAKWVLPFEEFIENNSYGTPGEQSTTNSPVRPGKTSKKKSDEAVVPGQELCEFCNRGDKEDQMLLCDDCGRGFHMFCLTPPMQTLPESDWFCAKCLREVGNDYGFEDGEDRSLYHFQKIADTFKGTYFAQRKGFSAKNAPSTQSNGGTANRSPGSIVITEDEVEREFWRLIGSPYDDVQVEYGADLHTSQHGSGFPVVEKQPTNPYSTCAWNLNNIPLLSESLFSNIRNDISGMMIPWIYIGMVFSTFCWHTEDHYTYSVNYHHFGETKTWYGIPSSDADAFEQCMRKTVPELFEGNPDLLFHLTTMLSPSVLTEHGVEVVVLDQRPGDFVITFPRSYHAGFNHGFNCAEAVNFALPDWLPYGLSCVERYHMYKRMPVFCHDELIVTTWKKDKSVKSAIWLEGQLQYVVKRQTALRIEVRKGFPNLREVEEEFGMPLEDEGQCVLCHQYCYLSRITCANCSPSSAVCLSHAEEICSCTNPKIVMKVRFSDQKLLEILLEVSKIAQQPVRWKQMYLETLSRQRLPPLKELIELHSVGAPFAGADESHTAELRHLRRFIDRAHKWIESAGRIMQPTKSNVRSIRRTVGRKSNPDVDLSNGGMGKSASPLPDLTLPSKERSWEKLEDHIRQLENLQFDAPEVGEFRKFVDDARNLRDRLRAVLTKGSFLVGGDRQALKAIAHGDTSDRAALDAAASEISAEIAQLWSDVQQHDIYFEELAQVQELMTTIDWRLDIETKLNSKAKITYEEILELMDDAKDHGARADHPVVIRLRKLKQQGDSWRLAATTLTKARTISMEELEDILGRAEGVPVHQDVLQELQECYERVKRWVEMAKRQLGNAGLLDTASVAGVPVQSTPSNQSIDTPIFGSSVTSGGVTDVQAQANAKCKPSVEALKELMTTYTDISGKLPPIRLDPELVHIVREEVRIAEEWSSRWRKRMFPKNPTGSFASLLAETSAVMAASFESLPETAKDTCLCRGTQSSFMIECQSCHELFHGSCVRVSKKGSKNLFFLCPLCDVGGLSNNVSLNANKSLTFSLIELALREAGSPEADKLRKTHSFSTWLQSSETLLTFAPIELPHLELVSVQLRRWYPQVQKAMAIAGAVMSGTPVMAKETLLSNYELASRLRSSLRAIEYWPLSLERERLVVRNALAKINPLHPRTLEAKRIAEDRKKNEMEIEFIEEDPSKTFCICNQSAEGGRPMIMCDYCNDWFHFSCVLLTKEQVESIDKYCCPRCDSRSRHHANSHEKKPKRADSGESVERSLKMERAERGSQAVHSQAMNRLPSKPVSGPPYQQMRQYALPTATRSTVSFVGAPPNAQRSVQSSSFAPLPVAGEKRKRTDESDANRRVRVHPHTIPGPLLMKNIQQASPYTSSFPTASGAAGMSSMGHFTLPPLPPPPPPLVPPPPIIRSAPPDQRAPRISLPKPYDISSGSVGSAQEGYRHSISSSFGFPQHVSSSGSSSSFNQSYYRDSPSAPHSPSLQFSMYQTQPLVQLPRFEPHPPVLPSLHGSTRGQQSPYVENLPEYQ